VNCGRCGSPLAPGAKFCDVCGAPVNAGPRYGAPPQVGARGPVQQSVILAPSPTSITAMVTGIIGVVIVWFPFLGLLAFPLAVCAIVFAAVSLGPINRGERGGKGFAITGLVTGVITLALFLLGLFAAISYLNFAGSF
jgi:hypothetical protein